MKSKSKVPFKSNKNYNLNGVDVNLLLKNPSYIRKIVKGNHKEESYHDRDELEKEEEEDEDAGDDKLERHMKKCINEYISKKHLKEVEQRGMVQKRLDILKKFVAPELPDMDKRFKNPEKGIIERKLK